MNGSSDKQADYQLIAAAIAYLEENHLRQPTLDDLAEHLAVSPYHLQRLFTRWAGISPKRFVQFLTVEHAKQLLADSHTLLETAYETGLSGPGRLHDLFVGVEAMTPGEFKLRGRGLTIRYGFHATPFGECLLATTERGVCGLNFVEDEDELSNLHARWPSAQLIEDFHGTAGVVQRIFGPGFLAAHHETPSPANGAPLRLLLAGTNFQIKVWEALLRIPPGSVCTYEDIALRIGQPSAARAVGGAVGSNAIAYLIPCHRVIRKSGAIREYRWGPTRKKALLTWEAAQVERREFAI